MKLRILSHKTPLIALFLAQIASSHALTWDANGTGAGQTNGGGAWLGANLWWDGSANLNWVPGSDAVFGGPNTAGGAVTLASPTSVGSITFNTFTGTYTLGTVGTALTLNGGITNNSAAGAVTIISPVTLGGSQTWSNNSTGAVTISGLVDTNGNTLTIDGSGATTPSGGITGTGALVKNGTGRLTMRPGTHDFSGGFTINGGVVMFNSPPQYGSGNLTLNGGVVEHYWSDAFTKSLGSGTGQVQILGGASGFSENGATGMTVNIGNASPSAELVWGSSFFSPSTLVLQVPSSQAGSSLAFTNRIDLNGASRTVAANGTALGVTATISGAIRNASGTAAGLIKTGPGLLILTGANTYNGGTTISQGNLRFGALNTMPASGDVAVQDGATLTIEAGAAGDWTNATSGNGSIGGILSGLGGQSGGTVSYSGNVTLGLETTANLTYSGDIGNVGTGLSIAKSGGSSLTLSGNNSYAGKTSVLGGTLSFNSIGNVGGGNSALGAPLTVANGTIDVGYRTTGGTIIYTGSGHTSDRVINLAAASGTTTFDASGTGPLTLASSLTAAAGAKTLTLTGTNTGANTIGATSIPGLAEVLTVTKSGAGTWVINGFSSPKNAWTVSAGTLIVNGTITTGDQNFTVSGGTLAGAGPLTLQSSKTLTIQAAGSLSPGNSGAGTMTVTGILNISAMASGTGKLLFEMGPPAASDKIAVTGTAQIGTGVLGLNDFVFTDLGGMTASTYVLISTTGGITGSLDPANVSGNIGSINGILQINGNNLEFTTDQDGDGLPDAYELANTSPPSATGLNPGDDLDGDGMTNLQEYLAGTGPNNSDSDADGLVDGVETNTGIWVSASNTGTKPLVFDTDGDTIRDGYETNTGIFVGSTNTGTNPNNPDTDTDSFADNVETNTGTYVSSTDTGTNPNNPDTDSDGAGDWYEVTASLTSPFLASEKPNVPYPLPDPDGSTGAADKPVKVYIMSGQSNMLGMGTVSGTGDGTLETMTLRQNKFPNLVTSSGAWTARQDVYYRGVYSGIANKALGPGCGSDSGKIGPELGFGQIMGWFHDEGVLLLKSSIGNRSLGWDILPPGSPSYPYGGNQYAGYGQSPNYWSLSGGPSPFIWYAGKQYDDYFLNESDMGPPAWTTATDYPKDCQVRNNGQMYISKLAHTSSAGSEPGVGPDSSTFWSAYTVTNVVDVLDNWATEYAATGKPFVGRDFQIAGFVWWQGDKDRYDMAYATRYEQNLVNLINSLRSYYSNRYPGKVVNNAPFVLATLGQTAIGDTTPASDVAILDAQLAMNDTVKYPQFAGNVKTVYAHPLSEGGASNSHYNNRAGTYMLVGDALGRAMVDLESVTPPATDYQNWASQYPGKNLTDPNADLDGDGQTNNQERIWGLDPTTGASSNPISVPYNAATGTLTYTRRNPALNTGVTYSYQWSDSLAQGSWQPFTPANVAANGASPVESVTITLPAGLLGSSKLFVRVAATSN